MKIKSHKLNWAIALCAVAAFSFTAARDAQARILPDSNPGPDTSPPATEQTNPRFSRIEPLPPIAPPRDVNGAAKTGTFNGTVIAD
jgi:hypothetical protein